MKNKFPLFAEALMREGQRSSLHLLDNSSPIGIRLLSVVSC